MPARAGIVRKIAHARPPPAPHPGPARGARTRPAIRKPARASLAPFLPSGQLNSQALHPIADSRLDGSEGNLQAARDRLLSVSAVVGQHDGFTLFRRERHQGAAYGRAFDAAEGLLHNVGAAVHVPPHRRGPHGPFFGAQYGSCGHPARSSCPVLRTARPHGWSNPPARVVRTVGGRLFRNPHHHGGGVWHGIDSGWWGWRWSPSPRSWLCPDCSWPRTTTTVKLT